MTTGDERTGDQAPQRVLLLAPRDASRLPAERVAGALARALDAEVDVLDIEDRLSAALSSAEQVRPAAIVVSSHVRSRLGLGVPRRGPFAYQLIDRADCPVVFVPADLGTWWTVDSLLARIVLADDASATSERAARTIARIAERGAEVIVLHVHEVDRAEAHLVDDRVESDVATLQAAGLHVVLVRSHALPHSVAADIAEVAHDMEAGMIVLGRAGASHLPRPVHEAVCHELLHRAPCPVLVPH